eukprot:gene7439-8704_t
MKILKPTWINHSGFPIFSVDVHPDGSRFATGGGDNKIKIWSMLPVAVREVEEDEGFPRLLKSIDSHFSAVNCVKWSRDGKFLASGSDDKLVMIWAMNASMAGSSFGEPSTENWVCVNTLRGHSADISEVAWSHDSRLLASASFDKTIMIWDVAAGFRLIKTLSEHKGVVKGLSWDPIGRYLTSQSDDHSVIVWHTGDWTVETRISEPFQAPISAFFLRPTWSPDGHSLCAPHGLNNATHTAVLIHRQSWNLGVDFVGHKKPVVVARYSPVIYREGSRPPYCAILLGGQDSTMTLWSSTSSRPLLVMRSLFEQCVQDISWCPDGMSFVACSTDGTVGFISLAPNEIGGTPISNADKATLLRKTFGEGLTVASDGTVTLEAARTANGIGHSMFAENPDQLAMEDDLNSREKANASTPSSTPATMAVSAPIQIHPTHVALQKQTQTIVNGKRRITPLNLGGGASTMQTITAPRPNHSTERIKRNKRTKGTQRIILFKRPATRRSYEKKDRIVRSRAIDKETKVKDLQR